jgi:hypothetical protein
MQDSYLAEGRSILESQKSEMSAQHENSSTEDERWGVSLLSLRLRTVFQGQEQLAGSMRQHDSGAPKYSYAGLVCFTFEFAVVLRLEMVLLLALYFSLSRVVKIVRIDYCTIRQC